MHTELSQAYLDEIEVDDDFVEIDNDTQPVQNNNDTSMAPENEMENAELDANDINKSNADKFEEKHTAVVTPQEAENSGHVDSDQNTELDTDSVGKADQFKARTASDGALHRPSKFRTSSESSDAKPKETFWSKIGIFKAVTSFIHPTCIFQAHLKTLTLLFTQPKYLYTCINIRIVIWNT